MRNILLLASLISFLSHAQIDTLVVYDYTNLMITIDEDKGISPITSLGNHNQAGLFMTGLPEGQIKICNDDKTFIWVDGRFLTSVADCEFFDLDIFFNEAKSDTIFVSFYSDSDLSGLVCELVKFQELQVILDDLRLARNARDEFNEFVITAIILQVLFFVWILVRNSSRISFLFQRTFSLKISSYESANTNFWHSGNLQLIIQLSLFLSFFGLYLSNWFDFEQMESPSSYTEYLFEWLRLSMTIAILIIVKWILVSLISRLFRFRDLNNFQLFDFVNVVVFLCLPIFFFLLVDYLLNGLYSTWVSNAFIWILPVMLCFFIVWFTLKFVSNSPRKKLLIISYLCATELIPTILILGWFYK